MPKVQKIAQSGHPVPDSWSPMGGIAYTSQDAWQKILCWVLAASHPALNLDGIKSFKSFVPASRRSHVDGDQVALKII